VVALASAYVRMRPQVDRAEFVKEGEKAGAAAGSGAGKTFAGGFKKDSQGRLRQANGQFATDAQKQALGMGTKSGQNYSKGFKKGSSDLVGSIKKNLGLAAGVFVPIGLAAAVGSIAKIGIAYENNLNIFKVVSKATGDQMAQVAEKARQLGADVKLPGVSAAGAAAAMTELAKAGFTVQQSMDAAQATLQLARIANISEADAAEIAANAVNAFGLAAKDTSFVVDELAAAANSSSIEIGDASLAFKQASAVFSGIQGPAVGSKEAITELNTAIAILGNNGIKGSDAGTSLKQAILQLTGPSGPAKAAMTELAYAAAGANVSLSEQNDILRGGTKARETAINAIVSNNKGIKDQGDIAYDASGKMRPLRDIINLVTLGTKGMTQENKNAAITQIFGADATRSIIALMKGGIPVYDAQRKAILQQGAAAQFAAAKNAGLGGAIDNVKSQFENAAIAIYNAAKGPLTSSLNSIAATLPKIFAAVGTFTSFIHDNIKTIRDWALVIGLVTLALKINSAMIAVIAAGGLVEFIKGVKIVTSITKGWAAAQTLLNITLFANPIGLVIVALAAVAGALYLAYRNSETFRRIVDAAWVGIKVAISVTFNWITGTVVPALVKAWQVISAGALWLWHNALEPAFKGIGYVIAAWWATSKIVFGLFVSFLNTVVFPVVRFLYNNVIHPVFTAISKAFQVWWLAAQIVFAAFRLLLVNVLFPVIRFLYNNVVKPMFTAMGMVIKAVWNGVIKPVFNAMMTEFRLLGGGIKVVWNNVIKPVFGLLGGFIKNTVAPAFVTGVNLIKKAWNGVREAARVPVAFVVNKVINPFIGGMNAAAKLVGVKDRIAPITGFAKGGKISGAGAATDNRQAMVAGLGPVQLMGGEYIINRDMTRKAFPLIKWINDGMKGGARAVGERIGRPLAQYPGDGSEGWAFKDGGLVGWVKDVWGAISNPTEAIKKPFEAALSRIPGGGMVKDFLIGSAKKLLNGATKWIGQFAGTGGGSIPYTGSRGGRVGQAQSFIRSQNGKPYVWASAGPGGYDCSGIVSAAYNILKGRSPYGHTFSTESAGSFFDNGRRTGPLIAGWSHPGQSPASASVGHMAGQIAGMPFESTGSRGVHLGASARKVTQFAQVGGARLATGGLVPGVKVFDGGGAWPSGTIGANTSGHSEHVLTGGPNGDMSQMLDLLDSIDRRLGGVGGDVADALGSNARRGIQRSRTSGAPGRHS
jgi:TP901 family phage tail tape measure protein